MVKGQLGVRLGVGFGLIRAGLVFSWRSAFGFGWELDRVRNRGYWGQVRDD